MFFVFFFFERDKLLHLIMFCTVYILYNIITKIHIQNPSVLCVISHKNCRFRLFLLVFNHTWSKPVLAGYVCQLSILRLKNQTGPDLQTLLETQCICISSLLRIHFYHFTYFVPHFSHFIFLFIPLFHPLYIF